MNLKSSFEDLFKMQISENHFLVGGGYLDHKTKLPTKLHTRSFSGSG